MSTVRLTIFRGLAADDREVTRVQVSMDGEAFSDVTAFDKESGEWTYIEPIFWFASSDVQTEAIPRIAFGARINIF